MFQIKGFSADVEYSAEMKNASETVTAFKLGTNLGAEISSKKSLADQYLEELAQQPADADVREFAAGFFFRSMGIETGDMKSRYLEASVDLDRFYVRTMEDVTVPSKFATLTNGIDIEGFSAEIEISDDVGFYASAGIDKFYLNDLSISPTSPGMKISVDSAKITAETSDDRKVFLEVDARASAEMKMYSPNGMLASDMYVDRFNASLLVESDVVVDSLSIREIGMGTYGVYFTMSGIDYDPELDGFEIDSVDVGGDYYGDENILRVEGSLDDVFMPIGAIMNFNPSAAGVTVGSVNVTVYDLENDSADYNRYYDSNANQIINELEFDGAVNYADVMNFIGAFTSVNVGKAPASAAEIYNVSGIGITYSDKQLGEVPLPPNDCATVTKGVASVIYEKFGTPFGGGKFVGPIYVSKNPEGQKSVAVVDGKSITVDITGAALGIMVASDGKVSYTLQALPGYELDENAAATGFTITKFDSEASDITLADGDVTLTYTAKAKPYKIYVDGDRIDGDFYCGTVATFATDADFLYDDNGAIVGTIADGKWTYTRPGADGDLELSSIKLAEFTGISFADVNTPESNSITYTLGATEGYKYATFQMPSDVRFYVNGGAVGSKIVLIAEETKFNGHKGFLVKATKDGAPLESTLYLPVSDEGKKIMHVDQYGRTSELRSTYVVEDGQGYQKVTVSDYSIFFLEDDVPNYSTGDNGKNHNLLYIGIAVVVAIVALAGVGYFVKSKSA